MHFDWEIDTSYLRGRDIIAEQWTGNIGQFHDLSGLLFTHRGSGTVELFFAGTYGVDLGPVCIYRPDADQNIESITRPMFVGNAITGTVEKFDARNVWVPNWQSISVNMLQLQNVNELEFQGTVALTQDAGTLVAFFRGSEPLQKLCPTPRGLEPIAD